MKELIIDKKTRLNKIKDKESYTKLILNTKVNPKDLKDFINVNDLTIKRYSERGYNVYNERHINKLSFKENIEKLTLDSIYNYGADKNYDVGWHLLLPNLKEITFINWIHSIEFGYLEKCRSLEKINIYTDFMRYSDCHVFDLKMIKKIEIRSNNEMSLFERREINIEGELKKLYIENNKLYIITTNKSIIIDEYGNETNKEILNNNIFETKEEYIYYKKLVSSLKDNNNEELNNALNIVEKELIKKLTK